MTYLGRVREIYQRQAFKEFYSRQFSGKISPFIAAACVGTPVTPNLLTLLMVPAGLLGAALFMRGENVAYLVGGLLFVLLNILDAADGELARYTQRTSLFGDYLDRIAHYSTNSAAAIGFGVGLALQTDFSGFYYVALLTAAAIIVDDAMRDLLVTCGIESMQAGEDRKGVKRRSKVTLPLALSQPGVLLFSNIAFFHIVPIIALIQWAAHITWIGAAYYLLFAFTQIGKSLVRARKIYRMYA